MIGRRYTWWAVASFGAGLSLVLLTICLFLLVASAWMGFSLTGHIVLIFLVVTLGVLRGVALHERDKFWHPSFAEESPSRTTPRGNPGRKALDINVFTELARDTSEPEAESGAMAASVVM